MALECPLEEVCSMGEEEREHLLEVMGLPKNEDTDQEVDIEELTSSEDEGDLGYAAPFPGNPEQPEAKDRTSMRVATKRRVEAFRSHFQMRLNVPRQLLAHLRHQAAAHTGVKGIRNC